MGENTKYYHSETELIFLIWVPLVSIFLHFLSFIRYELFGSQRVATPLGEPSQVGSQILVKFLFLWFWRCVTDPDPVLRPFFINQGKDDGPIC